ncbi:MAG: hypothetical protein MJZ53_01315 [Paludibacteraceae bacterium]|nr:hypothetical protein [Paludibacteraceae bacterium]
MNRLCYQEKVNAGIPQACTIEKWNELIDSPLVSQVCNQIASLSPELPDYNDRKQSLKKRLPILIPHASAFRLSEQSKEFGGARKSSLAIPSGLAMLDVDHIPNPREWFASVDKQLLSDQHIYLVSITASGQGLRIIGERQLIAETNTMESIEQAQLRIATALGISEYDAVTKDLARASYIVPRSYILWIYEAWLCEWPSEELRDYWSNSTSCVSASVSTNSSISSPATEKPTFRDIPYADIVSQLMLSIGAGADAVQGERNTVYFSLANYMRYICDFSEATLLQVLPDFGLSVEERRQAIHSALGRPRKTTIPTILQAAIALCERDQKANQQFVLANQKSSDMPLPSLPPLLRTICRRLPSDYRPAMVIASLPILGALATRIRFEYLDCQEQSLSFFSCITAPAASGKSFIRKPIDLLMTPINEQDDIEREKERLYKEQLRASKNSKNQPQDPRACPRNNGVSISIAKLLQLLTYSEGKHLIGIGEEMDTLVKSERAGVWSQKSDIYRLAFDNAEYGQAYMSETSFSAHIPVYYNLLMTGTPNSMKRFFKDLENGLATRVCFAQLPDTSFSEIPQFAPYTDAEREEIIRWARILDSEQGLIECPQVGKVIADWLEQKRQKAIDADSHAADILRRRSGVIGFRAGMLCYLLEGHKFTKTVAGFTKWVAEYVFRNQMEIWGEQMEQELSASLDIINTERGTASSLLNMLPENFSTADLISLRAKKGQSVTAPAISMLLGRWRRTGRIEKTAEGKFHRLK